MDDGAVKAYPARWLILAVFVVMASMTRCCGSRSPPSRARAAAYYGRSDLMIGLLSMVFMIVYIVAAIPPPGRIDTWGFKAAAGLGAVLSAAFALLRGLFAADYTIVLVAQIGIALGQPLVIGAITKGRGALVPRPGAGDGGGAWDPGALRRALRRCSFRRPFFCAWAWPGCSSSTDWPCRGGRPLPGRGPRAPADAGRQRRPGLDVRRPQIDAPPARFPAPARHLLHRAGPVQQRSTWVEDIVRPRGFTISQAGPSAP